MQNSRHQSSPGRITAAAPHPIMMDAHLDAMERAAKGKKALRNIVIGAFTLAAVGGSTAWFANHIMENNTTGWSLRPEASQNQTAPSHNLG